MDAAGNLYYLAGDGGLIRRISYGASATFLSTDTATRGTWKGAYGSDGYNVINNASHYPSYATVAPSGQSSYTWAPSTADVRGLQKADPATDRIAAAWYSPSSFTVDVNLTDGQAHEVSLYAVDWDSTARAETVQVIDASSGAVLDTRLALVVPQRHLPELERQRARGVPLHQDRRLQRRPQRPVL